MGATLICLWRLSRIPSGGGRVRGNGVVLLALLIVGCGGRGITPTPGAEFLAVASWYGKPFHGRITASGERYNMYGLTAAHRTLPFGTRLEVTYRPTGLSRIVTVTDRGPFIRGRQLDLSYGAAAGIGLIDAGVDRVSVKVLDRDMRYQKRVREMISPSANAGGSVSIQFGAFRERENAVRLKQALDLETAGVSIVKIDIDGVTIHRVRLGPFPSREEAVSLASRFADEGYEPVIMPW